ncbi:MAG: hypothetical protein AAGB23_07870 [Pseudomonadota bacterium]
MLITVKLSPSGKAISAIGAAIGLALVSAAPVQAKNEPLPDRIRDMPDKLIKYKHMKNVRGSDRRRYDIKIQYGRASRVHRTGADTKQLKPREVTAFTRVLISPVGEDDYRKPSADRLSELFPGSMVYTSLNGSTLDRGTFGYSCKKKGWKKSSEFTTFVTMDRRLCASKGIDSGHRARIGDEMVVDLKLD